MTKAEKCSIGNMMTERVHILSVYTLYFTILEEKYVYITMKIKIITTFKILSSAFA